MKRKAVLLLGSFGICSAFAIGAAVYAGYSQSESFGHTKIIADGENQITVTLNQDNVPTIVGSTGNLEVYDYVHYVYTNASNETGYHVVLGEGGTLRKTEESNSLDEVRIVFEGSLKFESNYDDDFTGDHFVVYPTSGSSFNVRGNYWKITALSTTKIESLTLDYGCVDAAEKPSTNESNVSAIPTTGELAHLETLNGDIYFVFNGEMNGLLSASDLTIRENRLNGEFQWIVDCDYVEYRSPTAFAAYFNLSDYYSNRDVSIDIYCHLYVRNNQWDPATSDLRSWQDGARHDDSVVVPNTLTMDGDNKSIQLSANTWANSTGYFYQPHISFRTVNKHFGFDVANCQSGGSYYNDTNANYGFFDFGITYISKDRSTVPAADMFILKESENRYPIVASNVTYEDYEDNRYKVTVTFDITLFSKYYAANRNEGDKCFNIWLKLEVNGDNWDGSAGDVKTKNSVASYTADWVHVNVSAQREKWSNKNYGDKWLSYDYYNAWSIVILQLYTDNF